MKFIIFAAVCVVVTAKNSRTLRKQTVSCSRKWRRVFDKSEEDRAKIKKHLVTGRITNGNTASNGQFPWVTRLTIVDEPFDTFVCTGNIISSNFVITVRHCFDPAITVSVISEAGEVDRLSNAHVTRFSDFWWFAPTINPGNFNPDLAIVRLSAHYTFNDRINAVRLPARSQENFEWPGQPSRIIGWGRDASGDMPRILQWGDFRMETNCWSQRRATHLCSVAQDIRVETRGKSVCN